MKLFRFDNVGKGRTEGGVVYYYRWWFFRNKGYCRDGVKKTLYKDPHSNGSYTCGYRLNGSMSERSEYKGGRLISKALYNRKGDLKQIQEYRGLDGLIVCLSLFDRGEAEINAHIYYSIDGRSLIIMHDIAGNKVEPIPLWIRIKVCLKLFIIHRGLKFVWI